MLAIQTGVAHDRFQVNFRSYENALQQDVYHLAPCVLLEGLCTLGHLIAIGGVGEERKIHKYKRT